MRLASGKFKHLDTVKSLLAPEIVPAFRVIEDSAEIHDLEWPLILRSALKHEGSKAQLLSGKSLSIGNIDSQQKLLEAWQKVKAQPDVAEVILQQEINWDTHVTLIYEPDFFFAELKKRDGVGQFLYWTPLAQSLSLEVKTLKNFLDQLKTFLQQEKFWLLELGLKDGKLFLFQIHPVSLDLLSSIFSSGMVAEIVFSRMRFAKTQGLWNLLKTEWQARKFRQQMNTKSFHPSLIFLNWEFLFHYFRLFCMMKQLSPDAQSFAGFLA
ncbi:MAG: hypothetical protein H0V66_01110, partial [Bdellovibrionales bacterium]|nr:hypothetical protein [Bdellovibrionales bacterium]